MKRNFAIINSRIETNQFGDYEAVDITSLDSLINHSADNIACGCLEYETKEQAISTMHLLLSKLKPNGILTIYITDIKRLMSQYISGILDSENMLGVLKNKKSILSADDICTAIDTNIFKLLQIETLNNLIVISIQRISI